MHVWAYSPFTWPQGDNHGHSKISSTNSSHLPLSTFKLLMDKAAALEERVQAREQEEGIFG